MSEGQRQGQRAWRVSGNHVQWGLIVSMGSPTHTYQPNANEKASKEAKQGEPMPVFTRFLQSDGNTSSYEEGQCNLATLGWEEYSGFWQRGSRLGPGIMTKLAKCISRRGLSW